MKTQLLGAKNKQTKQKKQNVHKKNNHQIAET